MEAVTTDFGIQEALDELGIKAVNEGTSTGSDNFQMERPLNPILRSTVN